MGVICPCGVYVHAFKENQKVKFAQRCLPINGNLTYEADLCTSTLEISTLSLKYEDKKTEGEIYSFLFTANAFTSICCKQEGLSCIVTVEGTGMINNKQYSFEAIFIANQVQDEEDIIEKFVIKKYFHQNGIISVPNGSIAAKGCQ